MWIRDIIKHASKSQVLKILFLIPFPQKSQINEYGNLLSHIFSELEMEKDEMIKKK